MQRYGYFIVNLFGKNFVGPQRRKYQTTRIAHRFCFCIDFAVQHLAFDFAQCKVFKFLCNVLLIFILVDIAGFCVKAAQISGVKRFFVGSLIRFETFAYMIVKFYRRVVIDTA